MLLFIQEVEKEITEGVLNEATQEKTLSIIQLIKDGGLGGQIIIALLFVLLGVGLGF